MPRGYSNYSFVIDSSFAPFTMQEMLTPFLAYKEEFDKAEAAYTDLKTKADKFKYLAGNLDPESKAAQIYNGYADELNAQANDFAKHGLHAGNRRGLTSLRQRYQGEIGRLVDADTLRRQQWEEQRKMQLNNPTILFSRRADQTSLDEYLDNPTLGYESYNGALLAQQVGTAASAIAKGLNDFVKTGKLDEYTNTWIESHGFNRDQVALAISNPKSPQASKVLTSLVKDVVNTSGIPKWADKATLEQAYGYANQGLWQAIGQSQVHSYDNFASRLAANEASSMRKAAYESQLRIAEQDNAARIAQEAEAEKQAQAMGIAINPRNIYSQKDVEKQKNNIKAFEKYFDKRSDGSYKMNQEGLKEYNRKAKAPGKPIVSPTGIVTEVGGGQPTDSAFKQFIDSIGGAKYFKDGKMQPGNLGNLWAQYKTKSKYDATKTTEFDFKVYDSQKKDIKSSIQQALLGEDLIEVDFDSKTNTFKPSGDTLSIGDLNNDKYTVESTQFSPYGSTVMIKDDSGKIKRYLLPKGINPVNEANRDKMMNAALILQKMITSKSFTDSKGKVHNLTPAELAAAQQQYAQALQQAYLYHSQLGVTNKVKEQEFNPYGY